MLTLRKGTPYMLEAFRLVHKRMPTARFLLSKNISANLASVVAKYADLPIDWAPGLAHPQLAERLRSADIFVLPSIEDGLAFTVLEALACGLPAITTPNTGASDLIQSGVNGEVVPIRDPQAIADAIFKWGDRILGTEWQPRVLLDPEQASFDHFADRFVRQLAEWKLVPDSRAL
jgi:glycosyltransferase involved in cell wall biosynthesis